MCALSEEKLTSVLTQRLRQQLTKYTDQITDLKVWFYFDRQGNNRQIFLSAVANRKLISQ